MICICLEMQKFVLFNRKSANINKTKALPFKKRKMGSIIKADGTSKEVNLMIIQSKRVWVLGQFLEAQVEVVDGKIANILPYGAKTADKDYGDKRIVPGFIDIHTHGAYGFDTNDANEEGLRLSYNNNTDRRSIDKGCRKCCESRRRRI